MISIYNIKPKFQAFLRPVLDLLHKMRVTANQITISSLCLSLIIGLLFWFADSCNLFFLALPIGLFLRMALNALDGMMARTYNQQSKKGELLNELGDVVSDLFIFFPLLKFEPSNLYLVVIFISLSVVNEFSGLLGKVISGQRRYEGPMGKSDRAFVMGLYGLLAFLSVDITPYSVYIFAVINVLLIFSTAIRTAKTLKSNG
jgi:CDP-diacylglycerol--glycerol-3-phosphate 3-phosphatidyltransferase